MKKTRLYPAHWVRYVAVAVIIAGAIACALGIRDSMLFGGVRPALIGGGIVLLAGLGILVTTYANGDAKSLRTPQP